jgi:hypothetical protein
MVSMTWTGATSRRYRSVVDVHGHALAGQLGGVGVPQPVRVDALVFPGLFGQTPQQVANVGLVERSTVELAEQASAAVHAEPLPAIHPARDERQGLGIQAHSP